MRFAIDLPNFGEYSDPHVLAELARAAEDAGWDGCFIWDHIQVERSIPVADPWVALAAMALVTRQIRIGPLVTPLFRRHPWKVARETVTLDHLSGGRLTLGVGLGSDMFGEISAFDGPLADSLRAEMLDESLAIVTGLWSGESFSFSGKHFRVNNARFLPTPIAVAANSHLDRRHLAEKAALSARCALRRSSCGQRGYRIRAFSCAGQRFGRLRQAVSQRRFGLRCTTVRRNVRTE